MIPRSSHLDVEVVRAPSAITVTVAGELDIATEQSLMDKVGSAIAEETPGHLVLDVAGLRFCDSAGINALVRLRKLADQHGRQLSVVHAQAAVRRVLELTGLDLYLRLDGEPAA